MNKLVMGSLLSVFATTFAGCIFVSDDTTTTTACGDGVVDTADGETCDDGNIAGGDGCSAVCKTEVAGGILTTANWSFSTIQFNGAGDDTVLTAASCPGGQFDTAVVISQAVDANGVPIGNCGPTSASNTCFIDLYNCTDLTGTETVPAGEYTQFVAITNTDGSQVYATSIGAYVDLTAPKTFTAEILHDGGYFHASWEVTKGGSASTCAAAGADGVSIDSTVSGGSSGVADTFTCDDHGGYTAGIPEGSYTVSMQALNAQQQALGNATTLASKAIGPQNHVTELGSVVIAVP